MFMLLFSIQCKVKSYAIQLKRLEIQLYNVIYKPHTVANTSCNPTTGLHYRNQADMLHCLSFYSKDFNSSHCKHFFHEVSSRNEGMPTALIPTFINQTAAHCNPQTTCATVFLLDGPSKNPLFTIHTLWTKTPVLDNSHLL